MVTVCFFNIKLVDGDLLGNEVLLIHFNDFELWVLTIAGRPPSLDGDTKREFLPLFGILQLEVLFCFSAEQLHSYRLLEPFNEHIVPP